MLLGDCQKEFQGGNLSTEKLGMLSLICRCRTKCFLSGLPPSARLGRQEGAVPGVEVGNLHSCSCRRA